MGTKLTNKNLAGLIKQAQADVALLRIKEVILWDEEITGLGLRAGKTGKASWLVKKHLGKGGRGSKLIWVTLGDASLLTLDQARDKARSAIEDIRNGINPNDKTRETRQADIEAYRDGKLQDLWDTWLAKSRVRGKTKHLKATDYWHGVERLGKAEIIPAFGSDTPVRNITKAQARKLIEKTEARSPAVARMLFAALRPFFAWCVEREAMATSPLDGISPPKPVKARSRVLSDAELLEVWNAAAAMPYPFGPFYQLTILTAQRRDEVAGMEWRELFDQGHEWIIPGHRTKNGREHLVHLSPLAWSIIEELDKRAPLTANGAYVSPYVFTTNETASISGFSKAKLALDKRLSDVDEWRVHDIRRTVATGMGALGIQPHIVERILNHVSGVNGGIVGVYQRFEYTDERREALLKWSNHIAQLVLNQKSNDQTNIVTLHRSPSVGA